VLALEPRAPTPIAMRWCRRPPEALAQRPGDDSSHHDAARQVEADDESCPPVDELLDVVRSAVEDPAVAGHRCSGPAPVLVGALQTQAVPPDMNRAPAVRRAPAANVDLPLPAHPITTIRSAPNAWAAAATTPCWLLVLVHGEPAPRAPKHLGQPRQIPRRRGNLA
jgi:hypothetical protein